MIPTVPTGHAAVTCTRCHARGPEGTTDFLAALAALGARWTYTTVADGVARRRVYVCPGCQPLRCACGATYSHEAWQALPQRGNTTVDGQSLAWRGCTALRADGSLCGSTITREVPRGG